MQKITAIIMSVLMLVLNALIPGFIFPGTDTVETGEWLTMVNAEFGMTFDGNTDPYFDDITADNEYFEAVQTAAEWDVLVDYDSIDVFAPVTAEFVATTLVNVAKLTPCDGVTIKNASKFANADKIAVAVGNGVVALDATGRFSTGVMAREDCEKALAATFEIWSSKSFAENEGDMETADGVVDLTDVKDYKVDGTTVTLPAGTDLNVGDVYILPQATGNIAGAAFQVESVADVGGAVVTTNKAVDINSVVERVNYQGSISPNLAAAKITDGTGAVVSEGFAGSDLEGIDFKDLATKLAKSGLSFSIKGLKFKLKMNDYKGVDISVGGNICDGVNLNKAYSLRNLQVDAKVDANLAKLKFKEAYVMFDYDLVETTTLSGSYAASVAPKDLGEDADPVTFLDRVKNNLFTVQSGGGSVISIASFSFPLGPTALTIDLNLSLVISVSGRVELVVTSTEHKGYEIIDNHGRFISDSEVHDRKINAAGDFSLCLGFNAGVGIFGFTIVDVGFQAGVGVHVYTTVFIYNDQGEIVDEAQVEIPLDIAVETTAGLDAADKIQLCADAYVYGILKVSVGTNSIIDKIGLSKTWTIFDRGNATFLHYHIEESGVIDACSRAA